MKEVDKPIPDPDLRAELLALYTRLAREPEHDFGWGKGRETARAPGYLPKWLEHLPETVWESATAVGNPFSLGPIASGETVVDLGCGAGADVCIAALLVGPPGRVIGVDCTPAMVDKARRNAGQCNFTNVEIHEADITELPLEDACTDVVISNGAINLAPGKLKVFREIHRILRPGGRLQFADMVRDPMCRDGNWGPSADESWINCVQGALTPARNLSLLKLAGFDNAELVVFTNYKTADSTIGALIRATRPA